MTKQTAIEWLVNEIAEKYNFRFATYYGQLIQEAKAMEKEQIEEAWKRGNLPTSLGRVLTEKDYYNETYK